MARKRGEPRKSTGGKEGRRQRTCYWLKPPLPGFHSVHERTLMGAADLGREQFYLRNKAKIPQEQEKHVASQNSDHGAVFPFLQLPRELRDQVYAAVLDTDHLHGQVTFDSVYVQARYHAQSLPPFPNRTESMSSPPAESSTAASQYQSVTNKPRSTLTSLLLVCKSIHVELFKLLYRTATFTVHLDLSTPMFFPRESSEFYTCRHALPFRWNTSLITSLTLHIDLGPIDVKASECGDVMCETMRAVRWTSLPYMRSLRRMVIVVTRWVDGVNSAPWTPMRPAHTDELRVMLSRLIGCLPHSVRDLKFGCGDEELETWTVWPQNGVFAQIDGRYIEQIARELTVFRIFEERVRKAR
jgi:hypothetical protein